jgi:hypothetical protein
MTSCPSPAKTLLICIVLLAGCGVEQAVAEQPTRSSRNAAYANLVALYASGDTSRAATTLSLWGADEVRLAAKGLNCFHLESCERAAVLHLEAAASCFESTRLEDATAQVAAGRGIVDRLREPAPSRGPNTSEFLYRWHIAAAYLQQAYAYHADAFESYTAALWIRPGDPLARLGRATSVEASVLPDGFGGVLPGAGSLVQLIGYAPGRSASGREQQVDGPTGPYFAPLLWFLAKEYRAVVEAGVAEAEARLRLGRALAARGARDEAVAELLKVAEQAPGAYERALAHLCLGRLAQTAPDAARAYRAATEADPLLRQAWLGRSEAAWRMRDAEAARVALERAFVGNDERLTSWVVYHLGRGHAFPGALAALRSRVVTRAAR